MTKLNVEEKSIKQLLSDRNTNFLIPDYQRQYAWEEEECSKLWDDIFTFAIENDHFDINNNFYFFGSIVVFLNNKGQKEVIDGQQRLTSLILLLRAFYDRLEKIVEKSDIADNMKKDIAECIWETDEFKNIINKDRLKINSEVIGDDDKEELIYILENGKTEDYMNSNYATNYDFFKNKIEEFSIGHLEKFYHLPIRLLNNCTLISVEADSQEAALRIFSTLNDRGKPLADSNIFKAQFYKYYKEQGKKDDFIKKWKNLEEKAKDYIDEYYETPMDGLFTRYMYYERAKNGVADMAVEGIKTFFEKNNYSLFKKDYVLDNLINLMNFWEKVEILDLDFFEDERILKNLFILKNFPSSMWTHVISVYYIHNKNKKNKLNPEDFNNFLTKTIAFISAYSLLNPGINKLRIPLSKEMVNIIENKYLTNYKFKEKDVHDTFSSFDFSNSKRITKSILAWFTFSKEEQELPAEIDTKFNIEHIYAKNRIGELPKEDIESIGNKILLEKSINIRASDYRFVDKKKYYLGQQQKAKQKPSTIIRELKKMAEEKDDFGKEDIDERKAKIINHFIKYLKENDLIE